MAELMRIYKGLLRAHLAEAFEYRARSIFWLMSAVFPLVMLAVWLAVVREAGPVAGFDGADFASYYVAATLISRLTSSWTAWGWEDAIRTGELSAQLLRPADPFHSYLINQLSWKLLDLIFVTPLVIIAALVSPAINFPLDAGRLVALVVVVLAAFLLNHLIGCTFGMLAFWTTQSNTLYSLVLGVGQFLSGWIAPLAVFPGPIRDLAMLLPFRSGVGLPVELMIGRLGYPEIAAGLAVTMAWTAVFLALYRALWRRGLRRYEAVGA